MSENQHEAGIGRKLLKFLGCAIAVALMIAAAYFASVRASTESGMRGGQLSIQDFLYHILLVREYWAGNIASIYDVNAQQAVMLKYFGDGASFAMPVGVSPTVLIIWFPFALIFGLSPVLAQTCWISFGLLLFISGVFRFRAKSSGARTFLSLFFVLALVSWNGVASVLLGQTSLMAAGALFHLAAWRRGERLRSPLILGFLLTLKPTYYLFGLAYCFAVRRSVLLATFAASGVFAAAAATLCSISVIPEYLAQLTVYTSGSLPAVYQGSLHFESNNTFRAVLDPLFEGAVLARGVSLLLVFSLLTLTIVRLRKPQHLSSSQFFLAVVGLTSLLSPYFGGYEELVVASAIAICLYKVESIAGVGASTGAAFVLFLFMSHNVVAAQPVALLLKLLVFGSALWLCRAKNVERAL